MPPKTVNTIRALRATRVGRANMVYLRLAGLTDAQHNAIVSAVKESAWKAIGPWAHHVLDNMTAEQLHEAVQEGVRNGLPEPGNRPFAFWIQKQPLHSKLDAEKRLNPGFSLGLVAKIGLLASIKK